MAAPERSPRALLLGAFHAAVAAVGAETLLPPWLPPPPPKGRLIVAAAGKAAAAMAACAERHYGDATVLAGLAITRHGHGLPTRRIRVREAGHPLPDPAGVAAAREMLDLVRGAGPDDHLLALLSGGGSSLLTLPAPGLDLTEIQSTVGGLLNSGAPIAAINCVRKHLSATLGGQLARACAARSTVLMLSDVVGDDPAVIASGPFSPDPTTFADALAVLATWGVSPPPTVADFLQRGAAGAWSDTPKTGDPCFARVDGHVVGNGATALEGAAAWLRHQGVEALVLGDGFTGEARDLARAFAHRLVQARAARPVDAPPLALLSGGEAQVTVRGRGRGGRNAEFLLALALELGDQAGVHALAADTDGIDGSGDNAGALLAPDTLDRAAVQGLDARARLDDNDAYGFFAALGDLVMTGPSRTNANDFRALLTA